MTPARGRRSRVYDDRRTEATSTRQPDQQGDYMRAEPYLTHDLNRDGAWQDSGTTAAQRGRHGEGAESTGNSVRGALSGGLTGATTTRGGQQGGIGASAYDAEPTLGDGRVTDDLAYDAARVERDLTLSEQYGGAMEAPRGPIHSGLTFDELGAIAEPERDDSARDERRRDDT